MSRRLTGAIAAVLLCVIAQGCAHPRPAHLWSASAIAALGPHPVRLASPEGAAALVQGGQVKRLTEIGAAVGRAAGIQAELFVASDALPNAYAWSDGGHQRVAVTTGMMDLLGTDWDAHAALLGHEFAHFVLKHRESRQQRAESLEAGTAVAALALGLVGLPIGGFVADATGTVLERAYSRDEEREADRLGLEFMAGAGFDPRGAVRLWERVAGASGNMHVPLLSTHPAPAERTDAMRVFAEDTF